MKYVNIEVNKIYIDFAVDFSDDDVNNIDSSLTIDVKTKIPDTIKESEILTLVNGVNYSVKEIITYKGFVERFILTGNEESIKNLTDVKKEHFEFLLVLDNDN